MLGLQKNKQKTNKYSHKIHAPKRYTHPKPTPCTPVSLLSAPSEENSWQAKHFIVPENYVKSTSLDYMYRVPTQGLFSGKHLGLNGPFLSAIFAHSYKVLASSSPPTPPHVLALSLCRCIVIWRGVKICKKYTENSSIGGKEHCLLLAVLIVKFVTVWQWPQTMNASLEIPFQPFWSHLVLNFKFLWVLCIMFFQNSYVIRVSMNSNTI